MIYGVRRAKSEVHLLDEGYAWVPKTWDFYKDPKEEVSGNQRFRDREASDLCNHASRGRDSSYFGFSSHLWANFWVKNGGIC